MSNLTIRHANAGDIDAIMELLRQVNDVHAHGRPDLFIEGKTKYTPTELAQIIADDSRPIFVATDTDSTLLGYAFCMDENHAGANNLYDHVLDYARAHGYHNVTLNAWAANPAAVKFYESLGMSVYRYGMEQIL